MSLETRQKPYKALTTLNLPFIEKLISPGEPVSIDDLQAAQQTDEDVQALIEGGSLGEKDDDLHPSTIVPDPSLPTIQTVVSLAQAAVTQLEEAGEEIPKELAAVAKLDFTAVAGSEKGVSRDRNA